MRRAVYLSLLGLFLAVGTTWSRLPFEGGIFRKLTEFRGEIPVSEDIIIIELNESDTTGSWYDQLNALLDRLDKFPPRLVSIDFGLELFDRRKLRLHHFGYPLLWKLYRQHYRHNEDKLNIVSSPEFIDVSTRTAMVDPFITQHLGSDVVEFLLPDIGQASATDSASIMNVAGGPGTYTRIAAMKLNSDPALQKELKGKILLISPPRDREHLAYSHFPFYPSGPVQGLDRTELHANLIDSYLQNRTVKMVSVEIAFIVTFSVSLLTVLVLFVFSPLASILGIFCILAMITLSSILLLSHELYLPIQESIIAIALAYYFVVPYRLVVEYKGRWKYQQENKLMGQVETLKDNFMSLVSHNLKTPIARIQGNVETVLSHETDLSPNTRSGLQKVLDSTDDLNRFVSRILNLAKVEDPKYQVRTVSKDLNQILENTVDNHRAIAKEKGIKIEMALDPLFPIYVDPEMIGESFANILENAIKYSPENSQVRVVSREEGDWIKIEVHDSGPGISDEEQVKIFSKFYRGEQVKNKGIRGNGLGLYLVKYFVELHGGNIQVRKGEERGSVFTISLMRK